MKITFGCAVLSGVHSVIYAQSLCVFKQDIRTKSLFCELLSYVGMKRNKFIQCSLVLITTQVISATGSYVEKSESNKHPLNSAVSLFFGLN